MSEHDDTGEPRLQASPGYALGQLARALSAGSHHGDPDTRDRAARRASEWATVFQGMLSGALQVGSRVPVAGAPAWATLRVMQGGFATGELLAGGELQPHESELLREHPAVPVGAERAALNAYYLGEAGLARLRAMLESGAYRVGVPEEGALLVVAWLLAHGHDDQARALLDVLGPHMARLRFYPIPAEHPAPATALARRQTLGDTTRELRALQIPPERAAEREAVAVWGPLRDRAAALLLETVDGAPPAVRVGDDGAARRGPDGRPEVEGGWPCRHFPEGWRARAQALLDEYAQLRQRHQLCREPDRPGASFPILRRVLARCADPAARPTDGDVAAARAILATAARKRGAPGSERLAAFRAQQREQAARPTPAEIAPLLIERLAGAPLDEGLGDIDGPLAPLTPAEAARIGAAPGQAMPAALERRLRRCLEAPLDALVARGIITSGDELARVVPQVTAQVRAAGIADDELRRLYGAVYAAFRRRRSLLLLNLEHQVRISELPWVAAIDGFRVASLGAREQSRQALTQLAALAITAFPERILPNKLLQEIRALAEGGGIDMPVVDELAADIFMGAFSDKFLRAAQIAGLQLEGTLYERYYAIDYAGVLRINDVAPSRYGTPVSAAFGQLCYGRAGPRPTSRMGYSVAYNGSVIEQEQILTTHNLAPLFVELGLAEALRGQLDDLAWRCFTWACRALQLRISEWQPRLRLVKNAAYAWRQMVFFLSLLPPAEAESFLRSAREHLSGHEPAFQARFAPALRGLERAAAGLPADDEPSGARRFLGWSTTRHWLMEPE